MAYENRTEKVYADLLALHEDISLQAGELAACHGPRLQCERGCSDCCVDELTVFAVEAERIRRNQGELLREGSPHPPGACAFLDAQGACRIYEDRPYVCRTQGLPLRWLEETGDGQGVEYRDICTLNEAGPPVEDLEAADCWTLGPMEGRLAALQEAWGDGTLQRVTLRSLFQRRAGLKLPVADPE